MHTYTNTQVIQYDDRYGPLCLCAAVVTALVAIFIISCLDFIEVLQKDMAPAPSPPFPAPFSPSPFPSPFPSSSSPSPFPSPLEQASAI